MTKILIMVHNLTGGGAERVAALWAKGFVDRGYDVGMVLNCYKDTPITYKVPDAVRMYNIVGNKQIAWIANKLHRRLNIDTYYIRRLRSILEDFKPDVAIGVLQPWAEWARRASKGMKIKIVNTEHNSFERPDNVQLTSKQHAQKYVWNKRYDHVTVLTEADYHFLENTLNNVSVLPNPLAFEPVVCVPKKQNIILAAGRLDAWYYKGFDILIQAWSRIAQNHPTWVLQIAGDGEKGMKYLQSLAEECDVVNQINFIGYQSDMLPIYQRSSIFTLSSRYEGFGMVLIEAMSQGCAPIACDHHGRQGEIITREDEGILCPVEDAESLGKAMERMINDEKYRSKVQANAIKRSKFYSLDNIMDKWEMILESINVNTESMDKIMKPINGGG